jgi:hypothetical protein
MVSSPKGLGPEKDCAGKGQQQIQTTDPDLSSERAPHKKKTVTVTQVIKIWSLAPDGCFTSRQTGQLTVGRNIRLRLIYTRTRLVLMLLPQQFRNLECWYC